MDENQLNGADLVVVPVMDAENLVFDSEILVMDDVIVDPDPQQNFIAASSKSHNRDIDVIPKKYILRHWRRDIIPPALRRNTNRYEDKNETIEKLTNEATFVLDECLFLLSKDEDKLAKFVEQLKTIKKEVVVQVPKPSLQKIGDVIKDIYAVEKPKQNVGYPLVPLCFVIFDLEPLSLSLDFVFSVRDL
ncbi:hypothetical protein Tco_1356863 [Tanacetum coccineum]